MSNGSGSKILSRVGMTLIEVMIAMGVASVLMLALMEMQNNSNKSARNTSINLEWNMLVSRIVQVLNTPNTCDGVFAGQLQRPPAPDGTPSADLVTNDGQALSAYSGTDKDITTLQISYAPATGAIVSQPLISKDINNAAGKDLGGFRITEIKVVPDPLLAPKDIPPPTVDAYKPDPAGGAPIKVTYTKRYVALHIVATKTTLGGGTETPFLGAPTLTTRVPLPFMLYTDPANGDKVVACKDSAQINQGTPHDCHQVEHKCGGGKCYAACPVGENILSGGGRCSKDGIDGKIIDSRAEPLNPGQILSTRWELECSNDTDWGFATCCQF
jgi:hypothetical protein